MNPTNPVCSTPSRSFCDRSLPVLVALAGLALPVQGQVFLDLSVDRYGGGFQVLGFPSGPSENLRVNTLDDSIYGESTPGGGGVAGSPLFTSLEEAVGAVNSQPWIVTTDYQGPNEATYEFGIALNELDIAAIGLGPAAVVSPPQGAVLTPGTPTITWSGPADAESLGVVLFRLENSSYTVVEQAPSVVPGDTQWTPSVTLGAGSYSIGVYYHRSAGQYASFSTPTGANGDLNDFQGYFRLSSTAFSDFTVVPEPAEWSALAGVALLGFGVWHRRNRRADG